MDFNLFFYNQYWPIIGDDLWKTVVKTFSDGHANSALLETLLVLIPRFDHPNCLKDFCPISLCNVA